MRTSWLVSAFAILGLSSSALLAGPAAQRPEVLGTWSSPFSEDGDGDGIGDFDDRAPSTGEESARLPTAVNAAVLPDGRVLYWSQLEGTEDIDTSIAMQQPTRRSRSRILDLSTLWAEGDTAPPADAWSTPSPEDGAGGDMVGSEQRHLPDGRVLAIGGTRWADENDGYVLPGGYGRTELYGLPDARIFDPASDTWAAADPMHRARYYPSMVTLPDGRLLVAAGAGRLIYNSSLLPSNDPPSDAIPRNVDEIELFDPATGTWELGVEDARAVLPPFAHLHLLPNGTVLYPAVGMMYPPGGADRDAARWNVQRIFDPSSSSWADTGTPALGARSNAITTMLRLEPPYDRASILVAGGTIGPWPSGVVATPLSQLVEWHAWEPDAAPRSITGPLTTGRWHSSAVVLPTGEVVAFSGADRDEVIDPGSGIPVRHAELFDPSTRRWTKLADAARGRTLHNTAVLLRDGSILVGGHSPAPAHYGTHQRNPDQLSSNYKDPSFEVFRPPYLFRGARPVIDAMSTGDARAGDTFTIDTAAASDRTLEVALVRLGATTHGIDADQRAIRLETQAIDEDTVRVTVPAAAVAPPGHYYLFLLTDNGAGSTPSIAEVLRIDG